MQYAKKVIDAFGELAKKFGIQGREYVIDNFSNKIISKKLFNLFKQVYEL